MEIILGFIILAMAIFLISYLVKKMKYAELDRLEEKKLEVMNRPVLKELTKVKQLNMTGETETMFERWRSEWDEIVTVHLPDVEEMLFDAEEHIDKYRFGKSRDVQKQIKERLKAIGEDIDRIIQELQDLVGSEEKSRVEIEEVKQRYRAAKKQLLAHRHSFGKAADVLENDLADITAGFANYEESTSNGDYMVAREHVLKLISGMAELEEKIKMVPDLLVEYHTTIPNQIADLKDGYSEMLEKGYVLNHFNFEKETDELEKKLAAYKGFAEAGDVKEAAKGQEELQETMAMLYELYEKEVESRQYVRANEGELEENLSNLSFENDRLKVEIHAIQSSYHISEKDMALQKELEKQLSSIKHKFEVLKDKISEQDTAYSLLAESMEEMKEMIDKAEVAHKELAVKIRDLRGDEIEAREQIKVLRAKLKQANKWLMQYNVPGVPAEYGAHLKITQEALQDAAVKLEEKPLDMASVQESLGKAVRKVDAFCSNTKEMIEQMLLTERVIQYANRYRSRRPDLQEALTEAEENFRNYQYDTALEQAAAALEEIEPGILHKMEVEIEYEEAQ